MSLHAELEEEARAAGFAQIGVARPNAIKEAGAALRHWVKRGDHGQMAWMADRIDWRADPEALWPQARSVIMLAENYAPADDPRALLQLREHAAISVYARNRDYHDVVKKKLKRLGRWFVARTGAEIKVFVDTAPVMEKPLAEAAGIGWRGKHTNLVSRGLGSWFFLGAIFTTHELAPDAPHADHCGACRACLDVCPTAAFPAPGQLDARRCVSYLTIEHKEPIPRQFRAALGNRIYGCDDCLAVCPWNKFAQTAQDAAYWARAELGAPKLAELAALDEAAFREVFSGSPIKRIGRDRFVRNVLIAIGNSENTRLAAAAKALLRDTAPLVRGAAIWALWRLAPEDALESAKHLRPHEEDADVLAEWRAIAANPSVAN